MDYTKNWKKIRKRTGLPDISIKKHDIASTVANLAMAFLAIVVLPIPIWALPIAFIVSDILLMPIDFVITTLIPEHRKKKQDDIRWLKKRNKKLQALVDKYARRMHQPNSARWHSYFSDAHTIYKNEMEKNAARIEKIEEEDKKKREELEKRQDVYAKINETKMDQIKAVISELGKITMPKTLADAGISLDSVVEKSKQVKKLLKTRPESVDRTAGTFLLYGRELIDILKDIRGMDEETQASYIPKTQEAVNEYEKYLDRAKERIEKGETVKTTVDLNVLINELKNSN